MGRPALLDGQHKEAGWCGSEPGAGVPSPGSSEATPTLGPAASCVLPDALRKGTQANNQTFLLRPDAVPAYRAHSPHKRGSR